MTTLLTVPAVVDPAAASDQGSPGFLGFVFTFVLALLLVLLAYSLSRHLRKIDRTPDPHPAALEDGGAPPPTSSDAARGPDGEEGAGR